MGELHNPGIQDGAEAGERHPSTPQYAPPLAQCSSKCLCTPPPWLPKPLQALTSIIRDHLTIGIVPLLLPHPRAVSVCVDSRLQGAPCYSVGVPSSALCTAEAASPACLGLGLF